MLLLNISQYDSYNIYYLTELFFWKYNMEWVVIKSKFQVVLVPNYRAF